MIATFAALWARGYWRWDRIEAHIAGNQVVFDSACGQFGLSATTVSPGYQKWDVTTKALSKELVWVIVKRPDLTPIIDIPSLTVSWSPPDKSIWSKAWLPTYIFAGIAAFLWVKWPLRFNLRALLIAMTIAAVLAGVAVVSK